MVPQYTCPSARDSGRGRCLGYGLIGIGPPTLAGQSHLVAFDGVIGKSCLRLIQTHRIGGATYELVAYARY